MSKPAFLYNKRGAISQDDLARRLLEGNLQAKNSVRRTLEEALRSRWVEEVAFFCVSVLRAFPAQSFGSALGDLPLGIRCQDLLDDHGWVKGRRIEDGRWDIVPPAEADTLLTGCRTSGMRIHTSWNTSGTKVMSMCVTVPLTAEMELLNPCELENIEQEIHDVLEDRFEKAFRNKAKS